MTVPPADKVKLANAEESEDVVIKKAEATDVVFIFWLLSEYRGIEIRLRTSEPNEHLWDNASLGRRRTIGGHDANAIDVYNSPA